MNYGPFTEEIKRRAPVAWERYVRAVERERQEGERRRMLELYGRPVRFYSIEEVGEEARAA